MDAHFYDPFTGEWQTTPYEPPLPSFEEREEELDRKLVEDEESIPDRGRRGMNTMRVQLQETGNNIASKSAVNFHQRGVTVFQVNLAWDIIRPACGGLPRKCRSQCEAMIDKMKALTPLFAPAGVVQIGNVARKKFCCSADNKTYRADLENNWGHNLRN